MNSADLFIRSGSRPFGSAGFTRVQPRRAETADLASPQTSNVPHTGLNKQSRASTAKIKVAKQPKKPHRNVPDENDPEDDSNEPAAMSCFVMDGQM